MILHCVHRNLRHPPLWVEQMIWKFNFHLRLHFHPFPNRLLALWARTLANEAWYRQSCMMTYRDFCHFCHMRLFFSLIWPFSLKVQHQCTFGKWWKSIGKVFPTYNLDFCLLWFLIGLWFRGVKQVQGRTSCFWFFAKINTEWDWEWHQTTP